MNRYLRRLERFGKGFSGRRDRGGRTERRGGLDDASTPQDVTDARAKGQGHGKKTADKWNQ